MGETVTVAPLPAAGSHAITDVFLRTMGEPTGERILSAIGENMACLRPTGEQMTMGLCPSAVGDVTTIGLFLPTTGEQMIMGRFFSVMGVTSTIVLFLF